MIQTPLQPVSDVRLVRGEKEREDFQWTRWRWADARRYVAEQIKMSGDSEYIELTVKSFRFSIVRGFLNSLGPRTDSRSPCTDHLSAGSRFVGFQKLKSPFRARLRNDCWRSTTRLRINKAQEGRRVTLSVVCFVPHRRESVAIDVYRKILCAKIIITAHICTKAAHISAWIRNESSHRDTDQIVQVCHRDAKSWTKKRRKEKKNNRNNWGNEPTTTITDRLLCGVLFRMYSARRKFWSNVYYEGVAIYSSRFTAAVHSTCQHPIIVHDNNFVRLS